MGTKNSKREAKTSRKTLSIFKENTLTTNELNKYNQKISEESLNDFLFTNGITTHAGSKNKELHIPQVRYKCDTLANESASEPVLWITNPSGYKQNKKQYNPIKIASSTAITINFKFIILQANTITKPTNV